MKTLFITGASGFVGRPFSSAAARAGWAVTALARRSMDGSDSGVHWIRADLSDVKAWREALAGASAVVHLAAAVGRTSRSEFMRTNVDATRTLLGACAEAGVARFLFVSSIAAGFQDKAHYHYAISKQLAEAEVSASGLETLIVRPTIILGPGSSIGRRFRTLGSAPVVAVFGSGHVRVQPVHVDDVVAVLLGLVEQGRFDGSTIELGGPDVVSIEELLRRIHHVARGREPRVLHLPVDLIRGALGALERVSTALTPVTAGQFATFCNDGVASNDPHALAPGHVFVGLDAMIQEMVGDERA